MCAPRAYPDLRMVMCKNLKMANIERDRAGPEVRGMTCRTFCGSAPLRFSSPHPRPETSAMAVKRLVGTLAAAALSVTAVCAQGGSTATASTSLTTSYATTTIVTTVPIGLPTGTTPHAFTSTSMLTTTVTTTVPVTFAVSATAPAASPTQTQVLLDTHLDPAFGVLGAILILTGIPTAFLGHKNRWSSFFIVGFYTLALVTVSLILKFGVLDAINPPNKTLRASSCSRAPLPASSAAVWPC